MTPEHHAEEAAEAAARAAAPAGQGADLGQRLAWGAAYMQKHHQGAQMWEIWPSDDKGGGDLHVYWFDARREYADAELDTATGEEMGAGHGHGAARATMGGNHFVDFHYELHAGQGEPAAFLPWLAAEWGIAQFDRYFDDVPALIANGLPWLRERGTAASMQRALGWLGYDGAQLDEDGAWLHLDLGRIIGDAELASVAHVVRASLPAHVRFYRVFHGHEIGRAHV